MKELYIIVNEKIYRDGNNYFCENKDVQSTINYLSYKYHYFLLFIILITKLIHGDLYGVG
jgi:hypothetical protein